MANQSTNTTDTTTPSISATVALLDLLDGIGAFQRPSRFQNDWEELRDQVDDPPTWWLDLCWLGLTDEKPSSGTLWLKAVGAECTCGEREEPGYIIVGCGNETLGDLSPEDISVSNYWTLSSEEQFLVICTKLVANDEWSLILDLVLSLYSNVPLGGTSNSSGIGSIGSIEGFPSGTSLGALKEHAAFFVLRGAVGAAADMQGWEKGKVDEWDSSVGSIIAAANEARVCYQAGGVSFEEQFQLHTRITDSP